MTDESKHLPTDAKVLQDMVLSLQSQVKNLTEEKQQLIEQFRLAQQQRFGASSEAHPAQGDMFNEVEVVLDMAEQSIEPALNDAKKKPTRKTMADWVMKSSELFVPLYQRFQTTLLQQNVIQADEITLKVISEDKAKSYMWLYCTGTDSPNNTSTPRVC